MITRKKLNEILDRHDVDDYRDEFQELVLLGLTPSYELVDHLKTDYADCLNEILRELSKKFEHLKEPQHA